MNTRENEIELKPGYTRFFYKKLVFKKLSTKMAKAVRNSSTMSKKY